MIDPPMDDCSYSDMESYNVDRDRETIARLTRELQAARRECAVWREDCGGEAASSCWQAAADHDATCPNWRESL